MLTSKDVLRFCDPDAGRYGLDRPWIVTGKLYATNGRAAIRCDPAVYTGELATGKRPHVADVFSGIDTVPKWQPLPKWPDCTVCNGSGRFLYGMNNIDMECEACMVRLAGRKIIRYRILPILALPDCTWGVSDTKRDRDYIFFRFPGGEAVTVRSDES